MRGGWNGRRLGGDGMKKLSSVACRERNCETPGPPRTVPGSTCGQKQKQSSPAIMGLVGLSFRDSFVSQATVAELRGVVVLPNADTDVRLSIDALTIPSPQNWGKARSVAAKSKKKSARKR